MLLPSRSLFLAQHFVQPPLSGSNSASPDTGRLWVLTPDLVTAHFTLPLNEPGDSAQALGPRGTLLVADLDGMRAYRCPIEASSAFRNSGSNPLSLDVDSPVLGQDITATVDLAGTTGHSLARVYGYASPLSFPLGGSQVLLINTLDPQGESLGFPFLPGPSATFTGTTRPEALRFLDRAVEVTTITGSRHLLVDPAPTASAIGPGKVYHPKE